MKRNIIYISIILFLLFSFEIFITYSIFNKIPSDNKYYSEIDIIVDTFENQWEELSKGEYPQFPSNPLQISYSVFNNNYDLLGATSRDIHQFSSEKEKKEHTDIVKNIVVDEKIVGSIIFCNTEYSILDKSILEFFKTTAIILFFMFLLCFEYVFNLFKVNKLINFKKNKISNIEDNNNIENSSHNKN